MWTAGFRSRSCKNRKEISAWKLITSHVLEYISRDCHMHAKRLLLLQFPSDVRADRGATRGLEVRCQNQERSVARAICLPNLPSRSTRSLQKVDISSSFFLSPHVHEQWRPSSPMSAMRKSMTSSTTRIRK